MSHAVDERQICQYLLGKLGLEEQQRFEEQLMTQESLFDELMVLEDELIDEYLKGTLSPVDRTDFEKHFLATPERRQKIQFAQALRKHVAAAALQQSPAPLSSPSFWQSLLALVRGQSPAFRYGFQAALSAVIVAGLWMGGTTWRLSTQVAQIRSQRSVSEEREQLVRQQLEEQRRRSQELEQQLALAQTQGQKLPETSLSRLVATLVLAPGIVRSSGPSKRVTISSETHLVELKLELADHSYQSYRVVLQDDGGSELRILNKLKPQRSGPNQFVVLTLPAKDLPTDDYLLKLSGANKAGEFEPLNSYSLAVRRK
jgi:hypothetical protein